MGTEEARAHATRVDTGDSREHWTPYPNFENSTRVREAAGFAEVIKKAAKGVLHPVQERDRRRESAAGRGHLLGQMRSGSLAAKTAGSV